MSKQEDMLHVSFKGRREFNVRTAAIIMRDGHVLVCREDDDDYVMLPGGRIEFGERSDEALKREVAEELRCACTLGELLFTSEAFFHAGGEEHHQIDMFYITTLPDDFPFATGESCMETQDEGHLLRFEWVEARKEALQRYNLLPNWLWDHLGDLPSNTQHLIIDERS